MEGRETVASFNSVHFKIGSQLQIIGDIIVTENDNYQMEADEENTIRDHVQKPTQVIGVRSNKAAKTSAERGREFRARRALHRQQNKQQQQSDAIVEIATEDIRSAGPLDDNQVPGPSETRQWRETKDGVSELLIKRAKTAAQRMREYREKKKLEIIAKTNAQRQKEYRMRKKIKKQLFHQKQKEISQQSETTLSLARKQKQNERAKRYREKLKLKKQIPELASGLPSKEDVLPPVIIKDQTETHLNDSNCKELIFAPSQIQQSIQIGPQQVVRPSFPIFGGGAARQHIYLATQNLKAKSRDSSPGEKESKIFCPKCKTEVPHSAEGIQEDQTKLLIARVYHYLKQEYEDLKENGTLDLTSLSRFRQRTALATGVSEKTVSQILKDEEERNAYENKESRKIGRRGRKRPRRHTYTSSEDDVSEDSLEDAGEQSHSNENNDTQDQAIETLVVKLEPPEYHQEPEIFIEMAAVKEEPKEDPIEVPIEGGFISGEIKAEPLDTEDSTNKMPPLTKRRGRKKQRKSDVTSTQQQSQGDTSTAEAFSTDPNTEEPDESSLLGETTVKVEKFEIHEEGFS